MNNILKKTLILAMSALPFQAEAGGKDDPLLTMVTIDQLEKGMQVQVNRLLGKFKAGLGMILISSYSKQKVNAQPGKLRKQNCNFSIARRLTHIGMFNLVYGMISIPNPRKTGLLSRYKALPPTTLKPMQAFSLVKTVNQR